ncbi:hypothetical protein [Mycolicibacterium celeriflavum]|uniref:hypothetical protein n=1 Tax=Mycolicibacterium celeriflavum TaxID=1249101 RepID=UPI003CFB8DCA
MGFDVALASAGGSVSDRSERTAAAACCAVDLGPPFAAILQWAKICGGPGANDTNRSVLPGHSCVTISYQTLSARVLFWTEAIIPTSPLRVSAGVCVLAAGLLFGAGGAIASADDSSAGTGGASAGSSQSSGATGEGAQSSSTTVGATTGTATKTQPKIDRRFRLRLPDFRLSPSSRQGGFSFNRPTTIVRGGVERNAAKDTTSEDDKKDVETEGTETTPIGSETGSEVTPDSGTQGAVPGVQALTTEEQAGTEELTTGTEPSTDGSVPTVPADGSGTQADANENSTSGDDGSAVSKTETTAVTGPATPATKIDPLTNAFVTINGAMATWSQSLAALPTSKTPVIDAITSLQTMVTTVAGVVTRVPSDFYAMLGIPSSTGAPQSLIGGSGTLDARKVNAPTGGPLAVPHPVEAAPVVAPAEGGSLFGTMAPPLAPEKVSTTGTVAPLSVSGTVPLKTAAAAPSAKSIFEHVVEAVLVPASLTALAAVALPGVGALLVVAAAGVRVGYRQAKAALALRASGIARFAGPGPLGVVRSGSMVALRQRARGPRTKRAVCPEAERAARGLDRVA